MLLYLLFLNLNINLIHQSPNCDLRTQFIVTIHIAVPALTFRANSVIGTDGFDTKTLQHVSRRSDTCEFEIKKCPTRETIYLI
jgi:hypothetical protein